MENIDIKVITYIWNLKNKEKLKDKWNYEEFEEKYLEYYLTTIIPETIKEYNNK